jgi:hypothetical protein
MGNILYEMRFSETNWTRVVVRQTAWRISGQQVAVKVLYYRNGTRGWRTEVQALQTASPQHYSATRFRLSPALSYDLFGLGVLQGWRSFKRHPPADAAQLFFHVSTSIANELSAQRGLYIATLKPANVLLDGDFATGDFQR